MLEAKVAAAATGMAATARLAARAEVRADLGTATARRKTARALAIRRATVAEQSLATPLQFARDVRNIG
jgi:hypothetical protein